MALYLSEEVIMNAPDLPIRDGQCGNVREAYTKQVIW
jgi:hypothetical protein